MSKRSTVQITGLAEAITEELSQYNQGITDRVNRISWESVKRLVSLTRSSAPVGHRGQYRKNIACKILLKKRTGNTYVWYVKGKDARLTHLLVHGHATVDGGRTRANPFLQDALDEVLPQYEAAVERTIGNGD